MMRPDYRDFICHSAKGSTWESHKYIKRIDGIYYYPDSYKGGRHLSDEEKKKADAGDQELKKKEISESNPEQSFTLSGDEIDKLADLVILGRFGNGQERKEALGEHYKEIQSRVNQKLLGNKSTSEIRDEVNKNKQKVEAAVEKLSRDNYVNKMNPNKKKLTRNEVN